MSLVYDFSNILKEMPYISKEVIRIPMKYGRLPDNLLKFAIKQNEKFLDKYQSLIEEKADDDFKKEFSEYQNLHFTERYDSTNKKERLFESCGCKTQQQIEKVIRQSMIGSFNKWDFDPISLLPINTRFANMVINAYSFAGCTSGTELVTNTGTSTAAPAIGSVYAFPLASATIGHCYNQLALSTTVNAGNYYIGCYDDGTSMDILQQSGSVAVPSGYTYTAVTEFSMTATDPWIAFNHDNNTVTVHYTAASRRYKTHTYGANPNPLSGYTSDSAAQVRMKAGHT